MTSLEQPPTRSASTAGDAVAADQRPVHGLDPAQQSLADALRVSFVVLKLFMVILVIAYIVFGGGVFRVNQQERAVRLSFGKSVGDYGPGWHFGLPYPINEIIRIQMTSQEIDVNRAFWYQQAPGESKTRAEQAQSEARPLNPLMDGSLLTGDANIVHARYKISFSIDKNGVQNFVKNIGTPQRAEQVVRMAVERGVIHAVAQVDADEFLGGRANQRIAQNRAQEVLDALETGIELQTFSATTTAIPLPVYAAWHAVSNAESTKGRMIEDARKQYSTILGQTAGESRDAIYELVREYEYALIEGRNEAHIKDLGDELTKALTDLQISPQRGGARIGGNVSERINEAITYRTQVVETVKAEAKTFALLYDKYRDNPKILVNRLWEDMREAVLTGDVETLYMPTESIWLEMSRDPTVEREREKRRMDEQAAERIAKQRLEGERAMATSPGTAGPPR